MIAKIDESCKSLEELLHRINAGEKDLSLICVELEEQQIRQLELAIASSTSLQYLDISCDYLHNGFSRIVDALKVNKSLMSLSLYENYISKDEANALTEVVLKHPKLLYIWIEEKPKLLEEELDRRKEPLRNLINKWNTKNHNEFTADEIWEFYKNKDAMKCVHNHSMKEEQINELTAFDQRIECLPQFFFLITESLSQYFPSDLVKYTMCFCVQLQCNIKPIISNIPALPKYKTNYIEYTSSAENTGKGRRGDDDRLI